MFRFKRKLYAQGGSSAVNVPKPVLMAMNADRGDSVVFEAHDGEIVIRKERKSDDRADLPYNLEKEE